MAGPRRILPWWPHVLFAILEPLGLIMGWYAIIISPGAASFVSDQVPATHQLIPSILTPESTVISLQLGNVFLLLMALGTLICFFTTGSTVRAYLAIVAVADLGHIYGSYVGMGDAAFWDFGSWNSNNWGSIAGSAFLCVNRVATVLGLFGKMRGGGKAKGA